MIVKSVFLAKGALTSKLEIIRLSFEPKHHIPVPTIVIAHTSIREKTSYSLASYKQRVMLYVGANRLL